MTDPCIGGNYNGLQQNRWPPANIANTPADAISRLFMLPGAVRKDPELSWKYEVAPAAVGFIAGNGLGVEYANDLIMGGARTFLQGGHLFRLKLNAARTNFALNDQRLADGVADNVCKFDITESESLLFGRNFGVVTDIKTGPDGNLYVLSLSNGLIYRISRRP
jgi:glucose/arabinose dehydrogenase